MAFMVKFIFPLKLKLLPNGETLIPTGKTRNFLLFLVSWQPDLPFGNLP